MELLSAPEVAKELGITCAAVYAAVDTGRLRTVRKRPFVFTRDAVNEYAPTIGVNNGYNNRGRVMETAEA